MNDNRMAKDAIQEIDDAAAQWCLRMADGPFSVEERAAFRVWLDAAPEHQARFDKAVAIWATVEDDAHRADMVRHREQALASYRRSQTRGKIPNGLFRWRHFGLAVAATVCLAAFPLWKVLMPNRYETALGERRTIVLTDGSRVFLDADSLVTARLTGHARKLVLVRGRASFMVAKDASRPFSVASAGKVVVATGTAFSVERLRHEIQVILYEGHVRVFDQEKGGATHPQMIGTGIAAQPAERVLAPGKRLIMSDRPGDAMLTASPEQTPRAWEDGQLEFDDEPLDNAVERVNRYARDRKISVAPEVAKIQVSGIFNAGDVEVFASEVAATWNVKMSHNGNVITLSQK